jgi:Protein of unknown function (DUF3631)
LFRAIAELTPTVLLDEVDAIFGAKSREREDLRGLLNAGYRRGAVARRMGGAKMTTLEKFEVFCAKAFAGIGDLPDTIADRSIPIRLSRKTRDEPVERFRRRDAAAAAEPLRQWAESWGGHHASALREARPSLPDELDDRAQDVWEPLLAIADRAGDDWPERARLSALALSGNGARADESAGVQLLADVRRIFDAHAVDRMSSAALAEALHEIEEAAWSEWYGRPITARGIAKLLARYEIKPRSIRLDDESTPKGYKRDQFTDAWGRYLPTENATTPQPASLSGKDRFSDRHEPDAVADEESPDSAWIDASGVVADGISKNGSEPDFIDDYELDYYRQKLAEGP